ncbi:MAG: transcriptional regulator [Clostridiaceae bacterium]|jgi:DNA-binding MarR family transcriptional regulator|nr:transcriptional regulator [Clostridiaceae bacterium]MDF2951140.1 transcriptional regulator [Anaerocolumna sp.]
MNYDKLKLDRQLCFPLYVVSKELIKNYKPLLDPLGITYTQYIAFMALWETDNLTVKELGQKLFLDSGTLTPLLKKMEQQGFIIRERSATDERIVYIKLTKKGLELRDKAAEIPDKMVSCLPVSMEEAMILQKMLNQYLNKLEH